MHGMAWPYGMCLLMISMNDTSKIYAHREKNQSSEHFFRKHERMRGDKFYLKHTQTQWNFKVESGESKNLFGRKSYCHLQSHILAQI